MPARVEVVHAQSPLCHWSWGYEPVVNRLEAIYGKQVQFTVTQAFPYVKRDQWLVDYEMTDTEAVQWAKDDILPRIGLPVALPASWNDMPESCYPAGAAVKAAGIAHDPEAARSLSRALMFALFVEKRDTAAPEVIESIVRARGLDHDAMMKVSGDEIDKALGEDMQRAGHGANFYSLIVRDPRDGETNVALAYAYDPARVERAIDYVAGGKLRKAKVKPDVVAYAEEVGPVSLAEVRKMFALDAAKAKALLSSAVKKGELEKRAYSCGDFWATVA